MADLSNDTARAASRAQALEALEAEVARLRSVIEELSVVRDRDEAELAALHQDLIAAEDEKGRVIRQLIEVRQHLEDARVQAGTLANSTSFRFGNAIVLALKSPRGMLALPRAVWALVRASSRQAGDDSGVQAIGGSGGSPDRAAPEQMATSGAQSISRHMSVRTASRPALPRTLDEMRVAAIMDEFTRACFAPTCRMQFLNAAEYEQQLVESDPHLLLVESAWRGDGDSWRDKVANRSGELLGLLDMCRRRGIPTAFWNKEDPSHFSTFLETAKLFDHVFTTDIDSIRRYRAALGHDRVHLLPFGCQPRIHNPLATRERRHAFCFAGSYYHRYPERSEDLDTLVSTLSELAPVVIHDRNSDRNDPAFAFPAKFASMLRPALPYDRIGEAYKGYRFGINLTTIKQSQSMFARRVYELMACNTLVVSNYSRGLRQVFGDLVIASDRPQVLRKRLQPLLEDPGAVRRLRLQALRKVLREHTYERRMQHVARQVLGASPALAEVPVFVVAAIGSQLELERVLVSYARQVHECRRLVLVVAPGFAPTGVPADASIELIRQADAGNVEPSVRWGNAFVAVFHCDDYYGANYLSDLVLATRYSDAPFIGKGAYHLHADAGVRVEAGELRYREGVLLRSRACIARAPALGSRTLLDWMSRPDEGDAADIVGLAIDEFGYCRDGAGRTEDNAGIDGIVDGLDTGIGIEAMQAAAERLRTLPVHGGLQPDDAGSREVNAKPADFRATRTRNDRLFVVSADAQFADLPTQEAGDRFVCMQAPSRSFRESDGGDILQGTAVHLRELLDTHNYRSVWTCAPDQALGALLREYVATCDVRIRLTEADLHTAMQGGRPAPWQELLEESYPRLRVVVDDSDSLHLLGTLLDHPGPAHACLTMVDVMEPS